MDNATLNSSRAAAIEFAIGIGDFWNRQLGERLMGVYLIGSLAHGGFSARYSDIDIAIIAEEPLTPEDLSHMGETAIALSNELAPKLSLFWTDRRFLAG